MPGQKIQGVDKRHFWIFIEAKTPRKIGYDQSPKNKVQPDCFQTDGSLESTQGAHKFRLHKVSIKVKQSTPYGEI